MTRIPFYLAPLAMVACGGPPSPAPAAPRSAPSSAVAAPVSAPTPASVPTPKPLRALVEIDIAPDVHPPPPERHGGGKGIQFTDGLMAAPSHPSDTEKVITALRQQFLACFEGNGTQAYAVGVIVRVNPNGDVGKVTTSEAYGKPPVVASECAARALRRVTFAAPGGGGVDIALTLYFRPQD
jgi:hypothetical protein